MSEADVRKVAQGRVWTGRDAMKHGLVDSMGGLTEAIAEARRLAGLTEVRASNLCQICCCQIVTSGGRCHCRSIAWSLAKSLRFCLLD